MSTSKDDRFEYLGYLETHVFHACNLSCKGCSHFSPAVYAEDADVDLESFERDIAKISELFDHVFIFRLLGGEPFLSKKLKEFAELSRKYLPTTDIRILTNGTLISSSGPELLDSLAQNNIGIDMSCYPINRPMLEQVKSVAESHNLRFQVSFDTDVFHKRLTLHGSNNGAANFASCPSADCCFFMDGLLSNCSGPLVVKFINKRFGTQIGPFGDLLDLHQPGLTATDVKAFLAEPMDCCRFCNPTVEDFPWENKHNYSLQDWIIA